MVNRARNIEKVAKIYENWTETCILSCLEGCMGDIYTVDPDDPVNAVCILGDFAFYAGEASAELVRFVPENKKNSKELILVGDSSEWEKSFADCYPGNCELKIRHMIKKNPVFDRIQLEKMRNTLPDGYIIREMDRELVTFCRENGWANDFVIHFENVDDFLKNGKGFMALYNDEPVAGSSSYSYYSKGMEIEVITRADHRQKGLATACCAALILYCMDNGLNPSWDAANMNSVKLSQKLGYEYDYQYNSYVIKLNGRGA